MNVAAVPFAVSGTAFAATRAVQYAAIGIAAGLFAFLLAVWLPALLRVGPSPGAWQTASTRYLLRVRAILLGCCLAGAASALAAIALQGAEAHSASNPTRFGIVWGAGLGAWVLVLVVLSGPLAQGRVAGFISRLAASGAPAQPAINGAADMAPTSARMRAALMAPLARGWAARLIPRSSLGATSVAPTSARKRWPLTAIGVPLAVAGARRAADHDRKRESSRLGIVSDGLFVAGLLVLTAPVAPRARGWAARRMPRAGRQLHEADLDSPPNGAGVAVVGDRADSGRVLPPFGGEQPGPWDRILEGPRLATLRATGAALPSAGMRWPLTAIGVSLAALLALPALAGHATIQHPVGLFAPVNVIHVAAMAVWLGGLVGLLTGALTLLRNGGDHAVGTRTLAAALARFSPIAFGCVVVLILTGVVQALIAVSAWSQFTDTGYGRAIIVKVAALAVLVALAERQDRRSIPAVTAALESSSPPAGTARSLVRTLGAQLAVLVVVLAAVGSLAGSTPARDATTGVSSAALNGAVPGDTAPNVTAPNAAAINAANGMAGMTMSGGVDIPVYTATVVGNARIDISVTPGKVGQNTFALTLTDNRNPGHLFTATKQLTMTATLTQRHIGPLSLPVHQTGPGRYVAAGAGLGAPGIWTLQITDRTSDGEQSQGSVPLPIG